MSFSTDSPAVLPSAEARPTADANRPSSTPDVGVLITFPLSHFCEKARWALDHAGLSYGERGYAPAVHKLPLLRQHAATSPVLVGRRTLRDSTDILRFADRDRVAGRPLYPADDRALRDADALIARFDGALGPQTRAWFYAWALADPERLDEWAACGLGPGQRRVLRILAPGIARVIAGRLDIGPRSAIDARERIDAELDSVGAILADGRRYLGGDHFGAIDLTFAALLGPALCPPGYGGDQLSLPAMPDELAPQIMAWRASPAGRHAVRVYREHRRPIRPAA